MPDIRKPLVHRELNAEEAERLTPDLFPKTTNPLERAAQEKIAMEEKTPEKPHFIPPAVAKALVLIAGAAGIVQMFVPLPYKLPVVIGAALLGFIGGQQLPQFSFVAGKPILTGAYLAVALSIGAFIEQALPTMPPGHLQDAAYLALVVLAVLTGKGAPQKLGKTAATAALLFLISLSPAIALADDVLSPGGGTLVSAGASVDNTTTAAPFALVPGNTYCAQATVDGYLLTGSTVAGTAATSANGMFIPQNTFPCYPFKVIGDGKYAAWIPGSGAGNVKIFLVRW